VIVTPTNTGSLIAGAGVGIFGWSLAEKGNKVPLIRKFYTDTRKEAMYAWMASNKSMALLGLEAINFGIHGITSANAVLFALGNTVVNVAGLWLYLPFRQRRLGKERVQDVLQGVKSA
jgi:hypothetical protein